ncbi:restriction endonuclease [Mycobacteroides abscessus]|uniref:restriction endonuclease n=1 Tax=Mycobacteroides abscessus TaxID=36809 RepID=UPI00078D5A41|nr:restriction endonuclease [Mycobacteroides abscessus]AMU74390.1 hypothetical protein A3O06_06745 [Mycobacteroides abscessus]ANO23326.1 hypothetical protein BAB79_06740 [Mycobacteroides abscessus]
MTLITSRSPTNWVELENDVAAILRECGMTVRQGESLKLRRGDFAADVVANEVVEGISNSIVCECKFWDTNIPAEKVRSFRVVVDETGANRGYIISRRGFQSGAFEAAEATNVELVTYEQFQELYFQKWFNRRTTAIEDAVKRFHFLHEPFPGGRGGYELLQTDHERSQYDEIWNKYHFAAAMLTPFSPYLRPYPLPPLPFDVTKIERAGFPIPEDIKAATGYRELLALLEAYALEGAAEQDAFNARHSPKVDRETD